MKIFVAGATGAIGRPLVTQLVADGHEVAALVRKEADARWMNEQGAQAEIADAFDRDAIRDIVCRVRPEVVINELRVMPKQYNPESMRAAAEPDRKLREIGGLNLESAAKETGVKRYILQSSAFWYEPGTGPADEETHFAFNAPPAISSGCRFYQEMEERAFSLLGPAVLIARYGFFYGPRTYNAKDGDVSEQVRNRKVPLIGDASGVWSWIHIDDAARATATLAVRGSSGVYNIVDDNPIQMAEWLPAYARWLDAPPPLTIPLDQVKDDAGLLRHQASRRLKCKGKTGIRVSAPSAGMAFDDGSCAQSGVNPVTLAANVPIDNRICETEGRMAEKLILRRLHRVT